MNYQNNKKVELYDVVRVTTGYAFKNQLGIVERINDKSGYVTISTILNGATVSYKPRALKLTYRNDNTTVQIWYDLQKKQSAAYRERYTNIEYLRSNWSVDTCIVNAISAKFIMRSIGIDDEYYSDDYRVLWLAMYRDIIDVLACYPVCRFCCEYIRKFMEYDKNEIDFEIVCKIHELFHRRNS